MKYLNSVTIIFLVAELSTATVIKRNTGLGGLRSCADIKRNGIVKNGIYRIFPDFSASLKNGVEVYCDQTTDEGGWTVFQRRQESGMGEQEYFNRNWTDYVNGFGRLDGSFWLGLDLISELTEMESSEIRIDMEDWEGEKRFAIYDYFNVANAANSYKLNVGNYSGDAGDSFTNTTSPPEAHNGLGFSTHDYGNGNGCASHWGSGWWFNNCFQSALNGPYKNQGMIRLGEGIIWMSWHGYYYSLKRVEMKFRARDFRV